MSKLAPVVLILACVAVYDPPRMLRLVEPVMQIFAPALRSAYDATGMLPRVPFIAKRRA